jgi:bacterioferritin
VLSSTWEAQVPDGNPEIIEFLNEALTAELTAVNQYFIHYKLAQDWGYDRFAAKQREESIDEMKDAEVVIDRILYLNGMPNMQRLFPVRVGETVPEQLQAALQTEREAIERYNKGVQLCISHGDNGTKEVLEGLLLGEEAHADYLESQLALLAQLGEPHFLALQVR